MPGVTQVIFGATQLLPEDVKGSKVLDVGACDFNGSIGPLIQAWKPSEYLGVDIIAGPGVDVVCSADDLVARFGPDRFDIVLCIEMLEHTPNWRRSIQNMKEVLKPGGIFLATTRSLGYPCHGFPNDYWRYEKEDLARIFADFQISTLIKDPGDPGIFIKAIKPEIWRPISTNEICLYCVMTGDRVPELPEDYKKQNYFRRLATKQRLKEAFHRFVLACGRIVTKILKVG
ncbi:MAG: class I SAM-dependent methyltransferase [Bdellovibrionales bacterium]|nr:class I SAM-dependent methyltransferase [Bdellovibrionales bacterium]